MVTNAGHLFFSSQKRGCFSERDGRWSVKQFSLLLRKRLSVATEAIQSRSALPFSSPIILSKKRNRRHNRGAYKAAPLSVWKIRDHNRRTHEVHPMLWLLHQRQGLIVQVSNTLADVAPNILMIAINQQFSPFEFRTAAHNDQAISPSIVSSWRAMFLRVWLYEQRGGRMSLEQCERAVREEFDEQERAAARRKPVIIERRFSGIPERISV